MSMFSRAIKKITGGASHGTALGLNLTATGMAEREALKGSGKPKGMSDKTWDKFKKFSMDEFRSDAGSSKSRDEAYSRMTPGVEKPAGISPQTWATYQKGGSLTAKQANNLGDMGYEAKASRSEPAKSKSEPAKVAAPSTSSRTKKNGHR